MSTTKKIIIAFFLVFALGISDIRAEIIAINLTAEITGLEDPCALLNGQLAPDDIITGSYTYNSDTPDTNPYILQGFYEYFSPPYGITLYGGGFVFQTDPENVEFLVEIGNNHYGSDDSYFLSSYNNVPLHNGIYVNGISWQLTDYSGTALSSVALPTTPPVLEDWTHHSLNFNFLHITGGIPDGHGSPSFGIGAEVTSVALVPEPATVLLLALGGLALRRKRRVQKELVRINLAYKYMRIYLWTTVTIHVGGTRILLCEALIRGTS